ncbi:TetR/AcrR family transcriptional regulator [Gordonia rhizosphera]|uniref:Putative TetR family transcriptional regulator n=1 Tax=Gordonia rhizosphera NBRC 16068 TaxID=1108045 RepID=K6WJT6_9ACTN|nr:TetR/AcrR family transcriptional regulator [Gordonia rhizosphera]GAB92412.1 putative TetR family transcriptional regulator [Gordonia rhizosphera NBRC 16068]
MTDQQPTRGRGRPRDPVLDERILRATRALVAEVGYHRVSMESIAARAGVGKATLYRRWPTKADVITDAFRSELAAPPTPDTGSVPHDALDHLRELVHTLTLLGDPSVVAGALAERGEAGQTELRELLAVRADAGMELLQRGIARGELPRTLPVRTVVDQWAGYLLYRIVFVQEVPTDDDLRVLVDLLPVG